MKYALVTLVACIGSSAGAGVCDYRLSDLVRSDRATDLGAVGAAGGVIAAGGAGVVFTAAGFYTITNATTGAIMIGSTAAGASAAGTVGIIGGTSGAIGTAASIVSSPVVIGGAIVTAVVGGGVEVGCYFTDDRITDYAMVRSLLIAAKKRSDERYFRLELGSIEERLLLWNTETSQFDSFLIEDLYIVNGELLHRDWFLNTKLGQLSALPE